jgi:hypothetical protein
MPRGQGRDRLLKRGRQTLILDLLAGEDLRMRPARRGLGVADNRGEEEGARENGREQPGLRQDPIREARRPLIRDGLPFKD